MAQESKINFRIGTSGYSFADWKGNFYPKKIAQKELLAFYAKHFNTVEVNYTYYRQPTQKSMSGMVASTPDDFQFFVKAFNEFTHKTNLAGVAEFNDGIQPMVEAGKLGGLLFQFPQSFKRVADNRRYLAKVFDEFADYKLAIEFRDKSWHHPDVSSGLQKYGAALVSVDVPKVSTLFPNMTEMTSSIGYIRFHSRNGDNWYKGTEARYDYDYSDEELKQWLPILRAYSKFAKTIYIYFNNCHRGSAAKNAASMKRIIGQL